MKKKKKNKYSESIRWKSKSEAFVLYARLDTTPHTYITRVIRVSLLCFLLNYLIINFNNNNYSTSFHSLFSFFFFLKFRRQIDRLTHSNTLTHILYRENVYFSGKSIRSSNRMFALRARATSESHKKKVIIKIIKINMHITIEKGENRIKRK